MNTQQNDTTTLARRVREHSLRMTSAAGSSHIGSCLSVADILAVLYGAVASYDAGEPRWSDRDRVILSKGHAAAALYATLAEVGFFAVDDLLDHCADGSVFAGHASHFGIPGVEVSTGSLGHGLGLGVGMAITSMRRPTPFGVFVVMSDGECDEGSVWEAAMFAAHHRLGCLTAVIDYNKLQSLTTTTDTLDLEPLAAKWSAFGWDAREVDGHNHDELRSALDAERSDRPRVVIAHTVKGKGVGFMENQVLWHYRYPNDDELADALVALDA